MSMLALDGLRADLPATHLAALGLLRALDRHKQSARMAWQEGHAVLDSAFATVGELATWLAEGFAPVPIVAPQREGAERMLASPRRLDTRLLDARPVLPRTIDTYGADVGVLLDWAREPDRWDEPLAALVALLRRSRLTPPDSPPEPLNQVVGPLAVLAPIVLAAQPLRDWEAKPADEVLVALRRVGIATAYEAAVRRLHRLGVGVARIPVPGSSKPDPRLACALATPIHPQTRKQLEAHLLQPTNRRDQ